MADVSLLVIHVLRLVWRAKQDRIHLHLCPRSIRSVCVSHSQHLPPSCSGPRDPPFSVRTRAHTAIIAVHLPPCSNTGSVNNKDHSFVTARIGSTALIPCNLTLKQVPEDFVTLVLWYKDDMGGAPIFTIDARSRALGSAPRVPSSELGDRASFDLSSHPAVLRISPLTKQDDGLYKCRVDFRRGRTVSTTTYLNVVGKQAALAANSCCRLATVSLFAAACGESQTDASAMRGKEVAAEALIPCLDVGTQPFRSLALRVFCDSRSMPLSPTLLKTHTCMKMGWHRQILFFARPPSASTMFCRISRTNLLMRSHTQRRR